MHKILNFERIKGAFWHQRYILYIPISVGYLEIGNLWSRSCSWSRRCWSWSWSWSRNFISRWARDQHCYYVNYHTKELLKLFTNRRKRNSMERIHPGDTHGLRTSSFISFFNFRLGPGVYTAALEKCMHAHSWTENQAAEIQFCFLSFPFLFVIKRGLVVLILISDISDLDLGDSDLDLELWILILILISDPLVLDPTLDWFQSLPITILFCCYNLQSHTWPTCTL